MPTLEPRILVSGSTDTFVVTVQSDTTLSAQTVAFSFDSGATWKTAAWIGSAAKVRKASLTVSVANLPTIPFGPVTVLVKIDSTIIRGLTRQVQGVTA